MILGWNADVGTLFELLLSGTGSIVSVSIYNDLYSHLMLWAQDLQTELNSTNKADREPILHQPGA